MAQQIIVKSGRPTMICTSWQGKARNYRHGILEEIPAVDIILCPVGSGGQPSGIAVAPEHLIWHQVIGVEFASADKDAAASFKTGQIVPSARPIRFRMGR
jgi:threonine dehydratase